MIMWHNDNLTEVVKADAKCFVVTSNVANALLYRDDMDPMTFYGHDDEGFHTSYTMKQGLLIQDNDLSGFIFTFIKDFD